MIQRNCKNCGAPVKHSYNHKCEYCGTLFDFNESSENIQKIKPEDLSDIALRRVQIEYFKDKLILIFDGYKRELPEIFEYNANNIYISKAEEYINPPKYGFCIELPLLKTKSLGMPYILQKLQAIGVRGEEFYQLESQLYKNEELRPFCGNILSV